MKPHTNRHAYVDLGLPSGTLWATMNIGAKKETDFGNYYTYGSGSEEYKNGSPVYSGEENPLILSRDTAREVWGGEWYTPSKKQLEELVENTEYEWTEVDEVKGGKFTSKINGKTMFIPAAGDCNYDKQFNVGEYVDIWSCTPYSEKYAYRLLCDKWGDDGVYFTFRKYGLSVRAVIDQHKADN